MLDSGKWTNARLIAPKSNVRSPLPAGLSVPTGWRLTAAEVRVVHYLAAGLTPRRIAYSLGRSVHTIRTHLKRAIAKAGVNTQVALVARLYTTNGPNITAHRAQEKTGGADF
jgi:DNA-binding CsgD family transcriptional regulator